MFLSIIIPAYKVEAFIEKCINSCLDQNISKELYEIIVVNDGSPDNSSEIAKQIASLNSNITVIDRSNGGLSSARNTGIDIAKGDYYFFIDSDDWIEPNCLGDIMSILRMEEPDILYIGAVDYFGDSVKRRNLMPNCGSMRGKDALLFGMRPEAQLSITKASFMKEYNFRFKEGILHEDSELVPRMHYFAEKICFYDRDVYYFYPNPQSITRSVNPKKCYDIIQYVCTSLSDFTFSIVDINYKIIFHKIISMYINNALAYSDGVDSDSVDKLNDLIYSNRLILKHLWLSNTPKYMVEYVLFCFAPKNTVQIHKFLSRF